LCRCTGYRPIRDAAISLGAPAEMEFVQRLQQPTLDLSAIEVPGFSRPATIEACLAILSADPSAKLVAGATDVGVESNLHRRRWTHLVSVDAIDELREFSNTADCVMIGAGLPLNEIGRRWSDAPDAIREWLTL